jgi:hypothetical protein
VQRGEHLVADHDIRLGDVPAGFALGPPGIRDTGEKLPGIEPPPQPGPLVDHGPADVRHRFVHLPPPARRPHQRDLHQILGRVPGSGQQVRGPDQVRVPDLDELAKPSSVT